VTTDDGRIVLTPVRIARADAVRRKLADLGITPTTVEAVVPFYLYAYRVAGQYAEPRGA
jgi:hypothetical protein